MIHTPTVCVCPRTKDLWPLSGLNVLVRSIWGERSWTTDELATLKEYGPTLKPKLVLWFYYEGNDLRDLDGWEKNSPLCNGM